MLLALVVVVSAAVVVVVVAVVVVSSTGRVAVCPSRVSLSVCFSNCRCWCWCCCCQCSTLVLLELVDVKQSKVSERERGERTSEQEQAQMSAQEMWWGKRRRRRRRRRRRIGCRQKSERVLIFSFHREDCCWCWCSFRPTKNRHSVSYCSSSSFLVLVLFGSVRFWSWRTALIRGRTEEQSRRRRRAVCGEWSERRLEHTHTSSPLLTHSLSANEERGRERERERENEIDTQFHFLQKSHSRILFTHTLRTE